MSTGWVKLHRDIRDSATWKALKPEGRLVLIEILMGASYRESTLMVDGEETTIHPGQWLVSQDTLAERADVSRQNVRTALSTMEKTKFLTKHLTKGKRTILTVINWKNLQGDNELTKVSTKNQPRTNPIQRSKEDKKNSISPFFVEDDE